MLKSAFRVWLWGIEPGTFQMGTLVDSFLTKFLFKGFGFNNVLLNILLKSLSVTLYYFFHSASMANEMRATSNSTNHSGAHFKPFATSKIEMLIQVVK